MNTAGLDSRVWHVYSEYNWGIEALSLQAGTTVMLLLDALEAIGMYDMIQVHCDVSGAIGVGESLYFRVEGNEDDKEQGYLLVTGEDTVRGLHLDGLDVVIVVGRPHSPDDLVHIAGITGTAGRPGSVVNVVSFENVAALKSWERMVELKFERLAVEDIPNI